MMTALQFVDEWLQAKTEIELLDSEIDRFGRQHRAKCSACHRALRAIAIRQARALCSRCGAEFDLAVYPTLWMPKAMALRLLDDLVGTTHWMERNRHDEYRTARAPLLDDPVAIVSPRSERQTIYPDTKLIRF